MAAIVYDIKDHVMTVTLDRPQVRNAWNAELAQGLHDAWLRLAGDDHIRVCVVTANGGYFSAGMDLKDPPMDLATLAMPNLSVPCNKPIIVAVEGFAIGYASVFCLLADMVFAGTSTYFLYPEAKMGLFQGMMGGFPGRLQYKAGLQWLMTADQMSATRACEIGLVNEVVEDGKAYERAMEVAGKIARNAPMVVQAMKAVALGTVTKGPVEKNFHHNRMIARVMSSDDGKEGFASFKEKRSAKFNGK